ncbi:MAG TPA: PAS domain-containing protein [Polyangiales bacterium]
MPEPFARMFDEDTLCACSATVLAIGPTGTILWLNPAWSRFAEQNRGSDIRKRFGVGTSYFDGISGPLREYFKEAFAEVLQAREPLELDYECSSPEARITLRLRVLPVGDAGLLLEHAPVRERPFANEELREPSPHFVNKHGLISQCSNCRKVLRTDTQTWEWVPRWIAAPMPNVSHGICGICYAFYWKARLSRKA